MAKTITFTSTQSGANANYIPYLWQAGKAITKTDRYKDSVLLDFALVPADTSFVKLTRGAYITINSTTYPKWFTGYVTNDPDLTYLGKKSGAPVFGYVYQATSDEYVLSINPLGIVQPFFNVSMGFILKTLVNRLLPGVFDVSGIANGPIVAQYVVDPTKKFIDVVREFSDGGNMLFYGHDKKLYFVSQDDSSVPTITVDGSNKHFTPSQLTAKPSTQPIINDVTVLGEIEPQTYVHEYFLGTGFDSSFPLISSVFGADTTVLVDETFGSASFDSSKWVVYDASATFLKISNGYLNSLGGSANGSYDVRLQSSSPLPMDGRLRFTHGDWDFISGSGVIAGCWTTAPTSGLTGCLYGINVSSGQLAPVVSGTADSTQVFTIDTSKRYVLRTLVEFTKTNRSIQAYSYLNAAGVVTTSTSQAQPDTATWTTLITEINPATGLVTNTRTFVSTATLTGTGDTYALYIPLASNDLHATVTGITVSIPINATLETSKVLTVNNFDLNSWSDSVTPTDWVASGTASQCKDTSIVPTGSCLKIAGGSAGAISQAIQVDPNIGFNVAVKLSRNNLLTSGTFKIKFTGTGLSETGFTVPVNNIPIVGFGTFSGVLSSGFSSVPSDLAINVSLTGGASNAILYVDDIIPSTQWRASLIGPNEVDAIDGLAPIATITQSNTGSNTKSTTLGSPQYNPGQAQLVFFKDSVALVSNIPYSGQLVRLSYRGAGPAQGRVLDRTSMDAEAQKWGDTGYRSAVRQDLLPRPRNSAECEVAAAALVAESSFTHYEGTYTQWADYFATEPRSGGVFKLINIAGLPSPQVESISEVVGTIEADSPERFNYVVTFAKPDHMRQLLSKIETPKGAFQQAPGASVSLPVDSKSVGLTFAADVPKPNLVSWDDTYIYMDVGYAPSVTNGLLFEVRYTDECWGVSDGKNLIARSYDGKFQVPRSTRGQVFHIRQSNLGNLILWSEDQTQSNYSGATTAKRRDYNYAGDLADICTIAYSGPGTFTAGLTLSASYTNFCWSFDVRGPLGRSMTASVGATNKTFICTGQWQRVSLPFTRVGGGAVSLILTAASTVNIDVSRYSLEQNVSYETAYVRTSSSTYGPVSRHTTSVHAAFPTEALVTVNDDAVLYISADTILVAGNWLVKVDATASDVNVTVPLYSTMTGKHVIVTKVAGTHNVIILPKSGSGDTIGGGSNVTLTTVNESYTVNG